MRVVCAWCQQEGRSPLLRVGEPLDDTSETHGICDRHQQGLFETFPSPSFPSTRWLFIVSAAEPDAFSHLARVMRDIPGVTVIVDRRRGERRRGAGAFTHERRRAERRVRRPERTGLGYMLVRFAPLDVATAADRPADGNAAPPDATEVDRDPRP